MSHVSQNFKSCDRLPYVGSSNDLFSLRHRNSVLQLQSMLHVEPITFMYWTIGSDLIVISLTFKHHFHETSALRCALCSEKGAYFG